jgi:hypothetical protein
VLQAYKGSPHEKRLFVPFRDATRGNETAKSTPVPSCRQRTGLTYLYAPVRKNINYTGNREDAVDKKQRVIV